MKLIIKIPESMYEGVMIDRVLDTTVIRILNEIKNGTPLPKGHGDLIDRKALIENGLHKGFCDWYDEIKMADTIIEADKAENEE